MDWRRWDSLAKQSLRVIPQLISQAERIDVSPLTNDVQLEDTRIYDNVPFEPNLDPFRTPRTKGWLTNEQYASLLAMRAVLP